MKKFFAYAAAVSVCTLMLTACGSSSNTGADGNVTGNITTTTADTGSLEAAASYASIEEFIRADDILNHVGEPVDAENSCTYTFLKSLDSGSEAYIKLYDIDTGTTMFIASAENQYAVGTVSDDENISLIATDGKVYLLDHISKSGFDMELSEEEYSGLLANVSPEKILSGFSLDDGIDLEGLMSCKIAIGSELYTFEFEDDTGGILYYPDGMICSYAYEDSSPVIYNKFSVNVPAGTFDIPSDYEIAASPVDLTSLFE